MAEKLHIEEIIVVEGKNDIRAVKNAVNAEVIATSGLGLNEKNISLIKKAGEKKGIIILTDSDFAGEKIRKKLEKLTGNKCKHAFIPRSKSTKNGDIGVENSQREDIIDALSKAHMVVKDKRAEFTIKDMVYYSFTGEENSRELRDYVGKYIGIGYANTKQFLSRLNSFGITREEVEKALDKYYGEKDEQLL